jgi:hypothetical protein
MLTHLYAPLLLPAHFHLSELSLSQSVTQIVVTELAVLLTLASTARMVVSAARSTSPTIFDTFAADNA